MTNNKYTLKVWYYPTYVSRTYEHMTRDEVTEVYHFIIKNRMKGVIVKIYNTNIDKCVYDYDDFPPQHIISKPFVRATEPRTINGVTYYPVEHEED